MSMQTVKQADERRYARQMDDIEAWVREHPHSSSRQIAAALGMRRTLVILLTSRMLWMMRLDFSGCRAGGNDEITYVTPASDSITSPGADATVSIFNKGANR